MFVIWIFNKFYLINLLQQLKQKLIPELSGTSSVSISRTKTVLQTRLQRSVRTNSTSVQDLWAQNTRIFRFFLSKLGDWKKPFREVRVKLPFHLLFLIYVIQWIFLAVSIELGFSRSFIFPIIRQGTLGITIFIQLSIFKLTTSSIKLKYVNYSV